MRKAAKADKAVTSADVAGMIETAIAEIDFDLEPVEAAAREAARAAVADAVKGIPTPQAIAHLVKTAFESTLANLPAAISGPRETVITLKRPGKADLKIAGEHKQFAKVLALVGLRKNVYLYGGPGGFKTTCAARVAHHLGLPFYSISLGALTPESRLFGFMDANSRYVGTDYRKAYEFGGVFLADELDLSGPQLTQLNGSLDNGYTSFPDARVERHPDFVFIAAGNTSGRGPTRQFPDRRRFDDSSRARFTFMEWTYDEPLEMKIATSIYDGAGPWVAWIQTVRQVIAQNQFEVVASPRESINGAMLLREGVFDSVAELAESVVFKGLDGGTVQRILTAAPLPVAR